MTYFSKEIPSIAIVVLNLEHEINQHLYFMLFLVYKIHNKKRVNLFS